MRGKFRILLVLALGICLLSPLKAMEMKLTGDHITNARLEFNSSGADLSTPEGTAKAFLELYAFVETQGKVLDKKIFPFLLRSGKKTLRPFFTPSYLSKIFVRTEKRLVNSSKTKQGTRYTYKIHIDKKNVLKDGTAEIFYTVTLVRHYNCYFCKGSGKCHRCKGKDSDKCSQCKGSGKCRYCKGKGGREKISKPTGKLLLAQKGEKWLIRSTYKKCWSCRGKGKCRSCASAHKSGTRGVKVPGRGPVLKPRQCWSCKGTKVCKYCKGTTFAKNRNILFFLPSVKVFEGLPSYKNFHPDMSTPQKAFQTLDQALDLFRASESRLEEQLGKGVVTINNFFAESPGQIKIRKRTWKKQKIELTKTEELKDGGYQLFCLQKPRWKGGKPVSFTITLKQGKDGNFLISNMVSQCKICQGKGSQMRHTRVYACPDHPKSGSVATKRGTICPKCRKLLRPKMVRKPTPCYRCKGKGSYSMTFTDLSR